MGLFLGISGVIGANSEEVASALSAQVLSKGGAFVPAPNDANEGEYLSISENNSNVTVIYPDGDISWEDASRELSKKLKRPVFALHIHDDDLWLYELFRAGTKVDAFNPVPHYWNKDISVRERTEWRGNARIICECVAGLQPADIERYLVTWDRNAIEAVKAYPEDKSPQGDCWQMIDFMEKLKLPYNDKRQFPEALYTYKIPRQSPRR